MAQAIDSYLFGSHSMPAEFAVLAGVAVSGTGSCDSE
jgi:hypothetical protein